MRNCVHGDGFCLTCSKLEDARAAIASYEYDKIPALNARIKALESEVARLSTMNEAGRDVGPLNASILARVCLDRTHTWGNTFCLQPGCDKNAPSEDFINAMLSALLSTPPAATSEKKWIGEHCRPVKPGERCPGCGITDPAAKKEGA